MRLWGIQFGKGCRFGGNMIFYRAPGSTIKMGKDCRFNSNSRFNFRGINHKCILQTIPGGNITIGNNCGFSGVSIISGCSVTIGNNVLCGANVIIGDRNNHENIFKEFKPEPVTIGDNVWVGMNSVIMKGVTIGENSIIGANSVVTKSIPANVIAAGSPCKVIKERVGNESISSDI
jgi:acetyltransferase-like isoleucine patch superfamily enzyme